MSNMDKAKKAMKAGNFDVATDLYGEELQVAIARHGELSIEAAPIYFEYGKALFESSKKQQGLLGSKMGGAQAAAAMAEGDVSDAQIAWEVLESARVAYQQGVIKSGSKKLSLELAEVLCTLGELSMEQEQFANSQKDFAQALEIFSKHCSPDDRRIAFVHQQMAIDFFYMKERKRAIECYEAVVAVFEARTRKCLEKINAATRPAPSKQGDAQAGDVDKVVADVEKLLTEIKEYREIREEVMERIAELENKENTPQQPFADAASKSEIKSSKMESGAGKSEASKHGVTTIGFGGGQIAPSGVSTIGFGPSLVSSDEPVKMLGTFGSAKSVAGSKRSSQETANVLQAKKKQKA